MTSADARRPVEGAAAVLGEEAEEPPPLSVAGLEVEIIVEDDAWPPRAELAATVGRALAALLPLTGMEERLDGATCTVLFTDDPGIQALNRRHRGRDRPTNVLSFPAPARAFAGARAHIGDVVLAYGRVAEEATGSGTALADHVAHLVVHGVLHLLGHDHAEEEEAQAMERLEIEALAVIGIANPYQDDDATSHVPE